MKRKRFTENQIFKILKEVETGITKSDLCRKYGIRDADFYNWRARYGGMELSYIKQLKALEEENRRLNKIVSEQALDIDALKAG